MSYNFTQPKNEMNITEQEYSASSEIRFSVFTSCIGLIARNEGNVTGVHLVMFSNDDSLFDNSAADAAVALLGSYQEVVVIGQANMWESNFPDPYQYLISLLNSPKIIDVDDGIYGGRVEDNIFQTYQNGTYFNVS